MGWKGDSQREGGKEGVSQKEFISSFSGSISSYKSQINKLEKWKIIIISIQFNLDDVSFSKGLPIELLEATSRIACFGGTLLYLGE